MTTVYSILVAASSRITQHVTKLRYSQTDDSEFTVLKSPPRPLDLNPIEHLWDIMDSELTNWLQMCDAIMSMLLLWPTPKHSLLFVPLDIKWGAI